MWQNKQLMGKKNTCVSQKQSLKCFICNGLYWARECSINPNRGNISKPEKSSGDATLFATTYTTRKDQVEKSEDSAVFRAFSASIQGSEWYVDSGASSHMTNKREWLKEDSDKEVMCTINIRLFNKGVGNDTVRINELDDPITIENVMRVPELSTNLLSISTPVRKGPDVVFSEKSCEIFKKEECWIQGKPRVSARWERNAQSKSSLDKRNSFCSHQWEGAERVAQKKGTRYMGVTWNYWERKWLLELSLRMEGHRNVNIVWRVRRQSKHSRRVEVELSRY